MKNFEQLAKAVDRLVGVIERLQAQVHFLTMNLSIKQKSELLAFLAEREAERLKK